MILEYIPDGADLEDLEIARDAARMELDGVMTLMGRARAYGDTRDYDRVAPDFPKLRRELELIEQRIAALK